MTTKGRYCLSKVPEWTHIFTNDLQPSSRLQSCPAPTSTQGTTVAILSWPAVPGTPRTPSSLRQ
jgi:hypothetical protein